MRGEKEDVASSASVVEDILTPCTRYIRRVRDGVQETNARDSAQKWGEKTHSCSDILFITAFKKTLHTKKIPCDKKANKAVFSHIIHIQNKALNRVLAFQNAIRPHTLVQWGHISLLINF